MGDEDSNGVFQAERLWGWVGVMTWMLARRLLYLYYYVFLARTMAHYSQDRMTKGSGQKEVISAQLFLSVFQCSMKRAVLRG